MGLNFSAQINQGFIEYFKTLKTGNEVSFGVHTHKKEYCFNESPGSPKCKILLQDLFLKFPEDLELVQDGSDPLINLTNSSVVKFPRIVILIGKALAHCKCDLFGCSGLVSGKIEICDVFITSNYTPAFGDGLKISSCDLKFTAKTVESDLQLIINNNNYSSIVNTFLTSDNPIILNWIVNAILMFLKYNLMQEMNKHLGTIQPF